MKRIVLLIISLFFLLYFFAPSASALGISPGKISMDFVPNEEFEFEGMIINNEGGPQELDISAEGELKDYITLLTPDHIVIDTDKLAVYRFRLELPDKFDRPGEHIGIIWAAQHIEEVEGGMLGARMKVGTKIVVRVPYPGKYAEIALDIENANVNDTVVFDITVSNLGKENITQAKGEMEILDMENRTVVVLETEGKPIETTKSEILQATWFSDVDPGLYRVNVTVFYDGETANLERAFNLGAPLIKIVNVSAEPVINGTIGKVLTKIHSYWNQEIKDVYVELFVKDTNNKTIAHDKSQNLNLGAFSTQTVTSYWDTAEGFPLGEYKGLVILNYLDKKDSAEVDLELIEKTGIFGLPETTGNIVIIIIVVVFVAVVLIALFVFYRKRKEKNKQKELMSFTPTEREPEIVEEIKKEVKPKVEGKRPKNQRRG